MAVNAKQTATGAVRAERHPHEGSWLAGRVGHKLNNIIFIFILTYHKLHEIQLFVFAGNLTGCGFDA
jgi:hypothetical protein